VASCSRHGVATVRHNSERTGSVIPLSKNIYPIGSKFIGSVIVEVLETDKKMIGGGGRMLSVLPSCIFTCASTTTKQSGHYCVLRKEVIF